MLEDMNPEIDTDVLDQFPELVAMFELQLDNAFPNTG